MPGHNGFQLAEQAPGFVWRLQTDDGDAKGQTLVPTLQAFRFRDDFPPMPSGAS